MPRTRPFEQYSGAYDEWFEKNRDVYDAELEVIRRLIPLPKANGVEVGVGSGRFAAPLGIKLGVDPSGEMAAKARRRGISVCRGVAEKLPFSDSWFDLVLMVTTICFLDDIATSLNEAFRILKASGCILVGFVDRQSELGRQYVDRRNESRFYREATFCSTDEVLSYLKNAGFGALKTKQTLIPGESRKAIRDGFGRGSFVVIRGMKQTA